MAHRFVVPLVTRSGKQRRCADCGLWETKLSRELPCGLTTPPPRGETPTMTTDEFDLDIYNQALPDGLTVVARQQASGPHPHPSQGGKIVPFAGISELLLSNDTTVFGCDRCGKTMPRFRSLNAHLVSHSDRRHLGAALDDKSLRAIAVAVRRHGTARGRYELAAIELNEKGIKPIRGDKWLASTVSSYYRRHCLALRVRINRPKADAPAPAVVTERDPSRARVDAITLQKIAAAVHLHTGERKRFALAAQTLNDQGVKPHTGERWNDHMVNVYYRRYCEPVLAPEPATVAEPQPEPVADPADTASPALARVQFLAAQLAGMVEEIRSLLTQVAQPQPDPEMAEKARKWETFLAMTKD